MTTMTDTHDTYTAARRLLDERRPLDASILLEDLAAREPDTASVHELLGIAAFRAARLTTARDAFARVLEADPTDHYAHFALGRTLERTGRLTDARRHFRIAAALDPRPDYRRALERAEARCAA